MHWKIPVPETVFNKVAGLGKNRPTTLLKKSLWHRCFPVNLKKFLRTPFFTEHLRATASVFYISRFSQISDQNHEIINKFTLSRLKNIKSMLEFIAVITSNLKSLFTLFSIFLQPVFKLPNSKSKFCSKWNCPVPLLFNFVYLINCSITISSFSARNFSTMKQCQKINV